MNKPPQDSKTTPIRRLPEQALHAASRVKGIYAALLSAVFLGMAPVFGKQAILLGVAPMAVVAMRTLFAALLLLTVLLVFKRKYLYIYPAGLLGCLLAGWVNGLGSLFYYTALGRIDAGIGHLLYSLYPFFLLVWMLLDKQSPNRLTLLRIALAMPAAYLLTQAGQGDIDWLGIGQMLVASALYALHIPINQRVLFDMPAPTVTLYTLLAMSSVVVPACFLSGATFSLEQPQAWLPVAGLTLVTFSSRLMLFQGVKHLGGMQTALLGLSEMLVALGFSVFWLGEQLSQPQMIGAALLMVSMLLVVFDKNPPRPMGRGGWLAWMSHPALPQYFPWQPHD